ncbi:hypothetical protein J6T21_00050 [Candidatus Saccharibacteria bacterium]|nr:hypothetical protein [Candidatus Saccharibacteria bacterium]
MVKYNENGFITKLDEGEIFVFGSNGFGAHNGGAAAMAVCWRVGECGVADFI